MAGLVETSQWEDEVYQLETTDPVEGGPDGIDNRQAKQLANRTLYLKSQIESKTQSEQFGLFSTTRVYTLGEVCYTVDSESGAVFYWEWYSNSESLAGKSPIDSANRQIGWTDETKPFYWTPYKKSRPGTPLWPWLSETFPEGTLNIAGNSVPVAVFWRLAEAFPEYVDTDTGLINFPETGGEFFRVLDQSRGIDIDRVFGELQDHALQDHVHSHYTYVKSGSGDTLNTNNSNFSWLLRETIDITSGNVAEETRPRNLAFPILVEV